MNIMLWILAGGLLAAMISMFATSDSKVIGNIIFSLTGSVMAGLLSAKWMPDTPVIEWHEQNFSPSALLLAIFGSIAFLVLYNVLF